MYKILFTLILLFGTFNSVSATVPTSWTDEFDTYSNGSATAPSNGNICSILTFSCPSGATTVNVISTDSDTPTKSLKNTSSFTARTVQKVPGTNLSTDSSVGNNIYFTFAFKPVTGQPNRFKFQAIRTTGSSPYFELHLADSTGEDSWLETASSTYSGRVNVSDNLVYDQWNLIIVHYNKATRLVRYSINDGDPSATIYAAQLSGGITGTNYTWYGSGATDHLLDSQIVTDVDPYPQTVSRFTSATPLPNTQLTSTTTISFNLVYTSALPYVEEICIYLVGVTNPQNFIPKCTDIISSGSGLTFATSTTVTNNAVYTWHAEMYDFDGDLVDSLVQRTISVGTNSNPNQAWDDFIASSTASSTPIDITEFCSSFSFTIGAVCQFVMQILTPLQAPINNTYLQIKTIILSKVPFVYITQINESFRNAGLAQTTQFDGIAFKLTPQSTVTVLTQDDFNEFISPVGLAIMRAILNAVIWLSVLMFFWSQRNVFKI